MKIVVKLVMRSENIFGHFVILGLYLYIISAMYGTCASQRVHARKLHLLSITVVNQKLSALVLLSSASIMLDTM